MATINYNALHSALDVVVRERTKPIANKLAREIYNERRQTFLNDFENHPVTQEIQAGPTAASNFLTRGNLFSFIGFNSSDNPIGDLRQILKESFKFQYNRFEGKRYQRSYLFRFDIPDYENIKKQTELNLADNWAPGRSWVSSIENGFPGLDNYFYKPGKKFGYSRSGVAIQVKKSLGRGSYKRVRYLRELIKNLTKK